MLKNVGDLNLNLIFLVVWLSFGSADPSQFPLKSKILFGDEQILHS